MGLFYINPEHLNDELKSYIVYNNISVSCYNSCFYWSKEGIWHGKLGVAVWLHEKKYGLSNVNWFRLTKTSWIQLKSNLKVIDEVSDIRKFIKALEKRVKIIDDLCSYSEFVTHIIESNVFDREGEEH